MIKKLKKLTNIEILETDEKGTKVKFLDFIGNNELFVRNGDKYIVKAVELTKKYKIKTADGLFSLRDDIREVANHIIELGEEYIEFNLRNENYDKDPHCENRLTINELEAIVKTADFKEYYPDKLFSYNKHFDEFNDEELNRTIDELFEKKIIS